MNHRSILASALASLALFTLAPSASAADSAPPRAGLVGEAERWLTAAMAGPTTASDPTTRSDSPRSTTAQRDAAQGTTPASEQKPFVDFSSPNVSLVARDWRGSMRIVGSRTMLVDDLRPTASNRMVVTRLATDARLSTFVQLGVGEWRIDTAMFPSARSYSAVAGQLGVGFDLRIASRLRIAGEAQYTALYRDLHYTADEVAPRMVAFVLAVDGRF